MTISRALRSTTFPADFVLVAAMNPCPCGYRGDPRRACNCTPPQVEKYLSKISRPAAGPDRPARRGPRRPVHAAGRGAARSDLGRPAGRGAPGPRPPGRAVRVEGPGGQRPDDAAAGAEVLPAEARGAGLPQGGDGGAGPLGPRRTTRSCGWRGRWPTWRARTRSSRSTSPRRSATARSTGVSGREAGCWMGHEVSNEGRGHSASISSSLGCGNGNLGDHVRSSGHSCDQTTSTALKIGPSTQTRRRSTEPSG